MVAATSALLICAAALGLAPAALAVTNPTWSGSSTTTPGWSQSLNWSGVNPTAPVGTLTFPDLGGTCDAGTSIDACYTSLDDLGTGLTIGSIAIDDNSPYLVHSAVPSTDTLTLDPSSGYGINATASPAGVGGPAVIDVPILVAGSQTWKVDGGGQTGVGVLVSNVSGGGNLTLDLTNGGTLYATALDTEFPLTATGDG